MNKLPKSKRADILRALTEGNSIRATARMVGVSKTTVLKLLVEVGEFCAIYHDHKVRDLPCKRVEADEIWAFVGAKQKNAKLHGHGDIWTFTALCSDTKLVVSWLVGHRSADYAIPFMQDVESRQVVKKYAHGAMVGYSPPICIGADKEHIMGRPVRELVSTSYVERQNLNMRLYSRRHTRLTSAFSRKVENHKHAMALHFMVHNFCRAHTTLTKKAKGVKTSPAMAAGLTDHVWKIKEILDLRTTPASHLTTF